MRNKVLDIEKLLYLSKEANNDYYDFTEEQYYAEKRAEFRRTITPELMIELLELLETLC